MLAAGFFFRHDVVVGAPVDAEMVDTLMLASKLLPVLLLHSGSLPFQSRAVDLLLLVNECLLKIIIC